MAFNFNGNEMKNIIFNGDVMDRVIFNGDQIYVRAVFTSAAGGLMFDDGDFRYHIFNSGGSFTINTLGDVVGADTFETLVIAGGGGAGFRGGGGAGGYLTNPTLTMSAGAYAVTVGDGGAYTRRGGNGQPSSIIGTGVLITAAGGGGGGGNTSATIDGA